MEIKSKQTLHHNMSLWIFVNIQWPYCAVVWYVRSIWNISLWPLENQSESLVVITLSLASIGIFHNFTYLEVWRASWQNHFVSFTGLSVTCQCNICEWLFISQMFEGWNHVGLEIIPAKTKLLLVTLCHFDCEVIW